jgi:hypothetical protein
VVLAACICSARPIAKSSVCKNKRIYYVDAIEQEVLGRLKRELIHPRGIETYIAEYNAERRRLAGKRDTRRAQRERRQGEVARELARAVEAILKGWSTRKRCAHQSAR